MKGKEFKNGQANKISIYKFFKTALKENVSNL